MILETRYMFEVKMTLVRKKNKNGRNREKSTKPEDMKESISSNQCTEIQEKMEQHGTYHYGMMNAIMATTTTKTKSLTVTATANDKKAYSENI